MFFIGGDSFLSPELTSDCHVNYQKQPFSSVALGPESKPAADRHGLVTQSPLFWGSAYRVWR